MLISALILWFVLIAYGRTPIVDGAADTLDRGHLQHYDQVGANERWRRLQSLAATQPDELADAIGVVATVLGAGKDSLARTYVSLAAERHVPSLDLTALFRGGH
jgi:hypothetical protein